MLQKSTERKYRKSALSFLTVCSSVAILFSLPVSEPKALSETESPADLPSEIQVVDSLHSSMYDYYDYMREMRGIDVPMDVEIIIPANEFTNNDGADIKEYADCEKYPGAVEWTNQAGTLEWEVQIDTPGLYRIELAYLPTPGRSGNIEFEFRLNGAIPFKEAMQLSFQRMWKDDGPIRRDNRDNDLRPSQVDHSQWMTSDFRDKEGVFADSFLMNFQEGTNTLSLRCIRETFVLGQIRLYNEPRPVTYSEYRENLGPEKLVDFQHFFEAEHAKYKSDPSLYPTTDRISPLTRPYHPSKIRLNTIGGLNWRHPGQWIEWEIEVPEEGDYLIVLRHRQDELRGLYSHRRIYINGEIPFRELEQLTYPYKSSWVVEPLGDGQQEFLIRLNEGVNTIRMEAVIGTMGPTINAIERAIFDLNYLYRRIIMITGVTPDMFRDYNLGSEIPEMTDEFLRVAQILENELARIESALGRPSAEGALLREFSIQLKSLARNPRTVPERLERYKNNIASLSAWMMEMRQQPLELDYIWISHPDNELPRANETIWERLVHELKAFIFSFFENYDMIGDFEDTGEAITVWVGTGRDQAHIIKSMTDDMFSPEYNVPVNVSLVQGTLIEATMAGKGPDVALNVARFLPVDLAVRGALSAIDSHPEFENHRENFQSTAFIPYTFDGRVYALPETQEFNMLFYRKDIFEELDISIPETWEDLYRLIPILARRNMDAGVPSLIPQNPGETYLHFPRTFTTFLIQRGLNLYKDDFSATSFDDTRAIEAFTEFVNLYREFGLPVYYDVANRFRTGEMPLAIAPYTTYNLLYIFAPEIRNLWGMAPIPGKRMPDGSINRSEEAFGLSSIVFSDAKNMDGALDYVIWWTSHEPQARYGREMESLMGPAARIPTANINAFEDLPWSASEMEMLKIQWEQIVEQPEIPGSYFVSRNLNNAIIETVFEGGNPLATLEKYNKYINEEIRRKRIEFGMEVE